MPIPPPLALSSITPGLLLLEQMVRVFEGGGANGFYGPATGEATAGELLLISVSS